MEEDRASAGEPVEAPSAGAQTPPISIKHLMLWTLCCAVYLTMARAIQSLPPSMPGNYEAILDASNVIQGIATGATLAGAIVLVATRVRQGPRMLRQPGHWLLFISASHHVILVPLVFVMLRFEADTSGVNVSRMMLFFSTVFLVPAIGYPIAAFFNRGRIWRVLFVGMAVVAASQFLVFIEIGLMSASAVTSWFAILSAVQSWGGMLLAAAVVVTSIAELAKGPRRDWLHWTGIVTYLSELAVNLLWMFANLILR